MSNRPFTRGHVQIEPYGGIEVWAVYIKLGQEKTVRHVFLGPHGVQSFIWDSYPQIMVDITQQVNNILNSRPVGVRAWNFGELTRVV